MKKFLPLILVILFSFQSFGQLISIGDASTQSTSNPYYYPYGWWAGIYDQSEIELAGDIYSITVNVDLFDNHLETYNYQRIYIGHTLDASFIDYNLPDTSSMTMVYNGSIKFLDKKSLTIELNQPFTYNNSDNLMVYWENRHGSFKESVCFDASTAFDTYLASYGSSFEDSSAGILSNRPDIQLNFINPLNTKKAQNNSKEFFSNQKHHFKVYPTPSIDNYNLSIDNPYIGKLDISTVNSNRKLIEAFYHTKSNRLSIIPNNLGHAPNEMYSLLINYEDYAQIINLNKQ